MRGNVILICTSDRKLGTLVASVLACSGNTTRVASSLLDASNALASGGVDLALVDVASIPHTGSLISQASETVPVVALLAADDEALTTHLVSNLGVTNVMQRPSTGDDPASPDCDELRITIEKILRDDPFGLDKYLSGFGTAIEEITVTGANQRDEELERLQKFLKSARVPRHVTRSIVNAADELLTNAIYNAPRTPSGDPRYATTDRRTKIILEPGEYVTLRYGLCGRRFGISVSDNFGAFRLERLKSCLERCTGESDQIEQKQGGAGLGLFMISRSARQFVVNVEPEQRTEMIAVWELDDTRKRGRQGRHSLHYFETALTLVADDTTTKVPTRTRRHRTVDEIGDDEETLLLFGGRLGPRQPRGSYTPSAPIELYTDFGPEDTQTDVN